MSGPAGYLRRLKGNSRVSIATLPLSSIPYALYSYYLGVYLKETGMTDTGLGAVMVAGSIASLVFSIVTAPIVDSMGRKRSTTVFNLVSSALPPLIFFISGSLAASMMGMILFNANKIMSVGFYLLMIEDADDDERIVAFNMFNIITMAAGLLIPVAGLFVAKAGLVKAERAFLLGSFILLAAITIIRDFLFKETSVGQKLMADRKRAGGGLLKGTMSSYAEAFKFLSRSRNTACMLAANVFFYVYMNLGTHYSLYFVPYFTDRLGMDVMQSSLLGSVYYGGMLGAMVLINPFIGKTRLMRGLYVSAAVCFCGLALMAVIPAGIMVVAVSAVLVMSVGFGMLKSGLDGALAVYSEGEARSGVYSLANVLSSGLGIIVTAACAALYAAFPGWLYILNAAMIVCVIVCLRLTSRFSINEIEGKTKTGG